MSRVINFLSGNSATFNSGIGDWVISSGAATLSASKEKQKLSAFGSLKISPTNAASVVVADTQSIPADYLGWPIKFSYWAYSDISRNVTTTIAVTGDTTTRTTNTFLQGGIWSLIVVQQSLPTTVFGSQASCTIQISLAATATVAPVYISAPVLSTPDAIVYNTFNRETYELLPEYLRIEDKKQINPTLPLLRFMDVAFMETADLWDLWESIRYIAPDEYGVAEETSALVDPEKAPVAWLYWLAMILGFKFQTSAAGISSWGSLLTALDADSSGNLSWNELLGIDGTATWAELEAAAPNNTGVESDLRWQVASGVYGVNAGTKSAVITAVKHVLTGTQQVAINNFASGDPWKMEIVTITSETPDVVGGSSPTVLEAAFAAVPVGYEVTHRCVSAGEMVLEQAVLWLDAKYSTVGETTMANRGTGGPMLNAAYGAGASAPAVISHTGINHLYIPSTSGNYAAIPDTGALDITGDLELLCLVAPDSWTGSAKSLIGKWSANQLAYVFQIVSSGQLHFYMSTTGTSSINNLGPTTLFSVPSAGTARWLRVAYTAATGQAQYFEAPFSLSEPTSWTSIQTLTNANASVIASTTAPLEIGQTSSGGFQYGGKFYRAIVKRGTGASATVVADCNFMTGITTGDQTTFSYSGTAASTGVVFSGVKNLGTGGDSLNGTSGNSPISDIYDPIWLAHTGTNYLYVPGTNPNMAQVPDSTPLKLTGDFEIVVRAALDDWTPSAQSALVSKLSSTEGYELYINTTGTPAIGVHNGASLVFIATTTAVPVSDGTPCWLRVTFDASDGAGNNITSFFFAADQSTEPTSWTPLGSPITTAGSVAITTGTAALGIGSRTNGAVPAAGKFYRAIVKSGFGASATVVADCNFTTGITSGGQTAFTESSVNAATVTISRATSGYKSVAVTRSCWLLGATDYIRIPSYSSVKFMATDSMTAVVAVRQWGITRQSGAALISGRANTSPFWGWSLSHNNNTYTDTVNITGINGQSSSVTGTASTAGALATKGIVLDRSAALVYSTNASVTASAAASAVTSIESAAAIFVGANTGGTSGGTDAELFGTAIWNRALTPAELQIIDSHYNGTVTGQSTALLQSAIVWLDAGLSAPTGGLVRSASGARLVAVTRPTLLFSTNDFLQIDDNALLDFDASETFTVLIAVRNWSSSANGIYWIGKRESTGASVGWQLRASANTTDVSIILDDGPSFTATTNPLWFGGETLVAVGVVNRSTAQAISAIGSRTGTAASTSSFGNVASAAPLLIGTYQGVFMDAEFLGAAIFAGTLTSAQLDSVVTYFRSSL